MSADLPFQCTKLSAQGLQVLIPDEDSYETRVDSWWSADSRLTPTCIVQPKNAAEVSKVVKILFSGSVNFAIRSGGHSHWAGGSNVDSGVTIDLGLMKGITYDASTGLASVLPGGRWVDAYKTLETYGVAVPGGRDGNVGVGGFLTGGGNSYYTARAGFGCDSIVNAEVVLANGTIVNANKSTNSDLLKALKGGSGNFGIVTRFDLQTITGGPFWGGIRASNVSQSEIITNAMVNFTNTNDEHPENSFLINWTYNPSMSTEILLAQVMVDTTGVEKPAVFDDALQATELFSGFSVRPLSEMADTYALPSGLRNVWFSQTFANDARIIRKGSALHKTFVEELLAEIPTLDLGTQMLFQPLPKLFADIGVANGGNVLGLDRIQGNSLLWLLSCTVKTAEQETLLRQKSAAFSAAMTTYAKSIGVLREWRYLNYVDPSQANPITSYGTDNVKFLRKVSAKYDPTAFFQKQRKAGFKLP
ncbi:hypothetical protein BGZ61DRAFT_368088 [Ilyonectria robusta]|uniref:uncharacterized protein n=1 Tax=Ilyonectria robusta TaxID=1079257 RepID=UPI001E8EC1EF|nr:uncharacterized protein BGZ61DRAFT_368088 [Ilyonectria robusta]KAH8663210.1 hypothetical protein BGZ61DRAFT_368088 [Ilyonectria robusta]